MEPLIRKENENLREIDEAESDELNATKES